LSCGKRILPFLLIEGVLSSPIHFLRLELVVEESHYEIDMGFIMFVSTLMELKPSIASASIQVNLSENQ